MYGERIPERPLDPPPEPPEPNLCSVCEIELLTEIAICDRCQRQFHSKECGGTRICLRCATGGEREVERLADLYGKAFDQGGTTA